MKIEGIFLEFYQRYCAFIIPFLFILALGAFMDLKPLLDEWSELQTQENQLTQQLDEKAQALRQAKFFLQPGQLLGAGKNDRPLLPQVIQLIHLNFCELKNLQSEVQSRENIAKGLRIKILLRGDFFCFYRLLESLRREALPLRLDQLSLKAETEGLEINTQFSALPWARDSVEKTEQKTIAPFLPCCRRDPFEGPKPSLIEKWQMSGPFQGTALEALRFVGFFSEKGKTAALLLLPNGQSYDVYPGAQLGKTAWRVLRIDAAYLTLQDEAGKKLRRIPRTGA